SSGSAESVIAAAETTNALPRAAERGRVAGGGGISGLRAEPGAADTHAIPAAAVGAVAEAILAVWDGASGVGATRGRGRSRGRGTRAGRRCRRARTAVEGSPTAIANRAAARTLCRAG